MYSFTLFSQTILGTIIRIIKVFYVGGHMAGDEQVGMEKSVQILWPL